MDHTTTTTEIALYLLPTYIQKCADSPRYTLEMAVLDSFRAAMAFEEVRREHEAN